MTYSELVDAIMAWVNRPEVEQFVPTFILLCEGAMKRDLAENGITGSVVRAAVPVSAEYLGTPDDMGLPLSLHIGTSRLENVTEQGFDAVAAEYSTLGQPKHFTVIGGEFRFAPVPDTTYAANLIYEATLQPVNDANPTNWLLDQYPDAYMYGALAQAAFFLNMADNMATWGGLYASAIVGVAKAERAKRGSQTTAAYRPDIPHRHHDGFSC